MKNLQKQSDTFLHTLINNTSQSMDAVITVVCVMCECVDLPQASSVYTLTIRVCVCVCVRTQCTFLFLRNGTRAKPDAPVKESPHGHIRSYYYCHHMVQQPIRRLGWCFLCVSMAAAVSPVILESSEVVAVWSGTRMWNQDKLSSLPEIKTMTSILLAVKTSSL